MRGGPAGASRRSLVLGERRTRCRPAHGEGGVQPVQLAAVSPFRWASAAGGGRSGWRSNANSSRRSGGRGEQLAVGQTFRGCIALMQERRATAAAEALRLADPTRRARRDSLRRDPHLRVVGSKRADDGTRPSTRRNGALENGACGRRCRRTRARAPVHETASREGKVIKRAREQQYEGV